jgi:hypothetical protein
MKHHWHLQRTTQASPDGQRRWDQAYRLVLEWGRSCPLAFSTDPHLPAVIERDASGVPEEEAHAGRDVCAGLNHPPSSGA